MLVIASIGVWVASLPWKLPYTFWNQESPQEEEIQFRSSSGLLGLLSKVHDVLNKRVLTLTLGKTKSNRNSS